MKSIVIIIILLLLIQLLSFKNSQYNSENEMDALLEFMEKIQK